MKRLFLALFFSAFCTFANAQGYPDFGDNKDVTGLTEVSVSVLQQPRTLVVGISGQSMAGSNFSSCSPYTSTWTGEVYMFNPYDGKFYRSNGGPLLGVNGWAGRDSFLPYMLNLYVANNKAARVLMVPVGVGGSSALQWSAIGDAHPRALYVINTLKNLGIEFTTWLHFQGQADLLVPGQTAANFANLTKWGFLSMRQAGMNGRIIVEQGVYWGGNSIGNPLTPVIRQGQALAGTTFDGNTFLGPDDDVWPDTNYRVDAVHPGPVMCWAMTPSWIDAIPATP